MKRNIKLIIALLVVLALLGGGYFFISKWNPEKENTDENSLTNQDGNAEYVFDADSENIDFVKFNTGSITYTVKNGEEPSIEGYSSHIIDKYQLSSMVYSVTSVSISRRIENFSGNLSDYGIDESGKSVTVRMKDGTQHTLLLGNSTNFEDEYYAMLKGEDSVFTVSSYSVDNLMKNPDELRSKDICTLDGQNISEFTVKKSGKHELSVKYDENYTPANEYQTVSYLITYPYKNVTASLDRLQELFESVSSLTADSIVEENPKNLALYGLDKPYEVEFTDLDGNKTTVRMGDYGEDGNVYLMCNNKPVVYLAQCPFYETIKGVNAKNYVDRFINLFNIDTVKEIKIEADGEEHILSIEKKSEDSYTYKVGEKILEESNFKKLYQLVIGVAAADFTEEKAAGKEKCSITFSFNDGGLKKFTYYVYNDRYCIVKADNNLTCLTLTKNLDNILEQLK